MLAFITGVSESDAREIVLSTDTGKAIQRSESNVMYEQQTENLYSIKLEMAENPVYFALADKISVSAIVDAYKRMKEDSQIFNMESDSIKGNPQLKVVEKEVMKQRRKKDLKQKYQNFLNVGGIKNAD